MMVKRVNGFVWPMADTECARAVFKTLPDLDQAMAFCDQRRLAVQAGGNCGVWPAHLAKTFDRVVTFEPDAENFACLRLNVPANVTPIRAALGDRATQVGLRRVKGNCGAHYVTERGDEAAMVRLDDQGLEGVDLIVLDVEGYECMALSGADAILRRDHPVIMIEDKGLSEKYGVMRGAAERWLGEEYGYAVAGRINRDIILK